MEKLVCPMGLINNITSSQVHEIIEDHTPVYRPREDKVWHRFIRNTIGTIHQLPDLFQSKRIQNICLKNIEAYFGRSSNSNEICGRNLYGCIKASLNKRGHTHFIILGKTTINATLRFERYGGYLISKLREHGSLCIANKTIVGRGNVADEGDGILYMTFTCKPTKETHAPELDDRDATNLARLFCKDEFNGKSSDVQDVKENFLIATDLSYKGKLKIALVQ